MILPGMPLTLIPINELNIGDQVYDKVFDLKGKVEEISEDWTVIRFIDKSSAYTDESASVVYLGPKKKTAK